MNRTTTWIVPAVVLVAIALLVYFFLLRPKEEQTVETPPPPPPAVEPAPEIENPVPPPAVEEPEPLPVLDQSDELVAQSLAGVAGKAPVESFLVPGDVVRKTVATVDNLDAKKLFPRIRAVQPTPGDFIADRSDDTITIGDENYHRYDAVVAALDATGAQQLADVYFRYYPLFQQAYVELGYPDAYFNDRLVEVIDHLLATPDISGPIEIRQPSVYYTFADPDLETLSAGQKLLLRMGPENRATVKAKLREFRALIAGRGGNP